MTCLRSLSRAFSISLKDYFPTVSSRVHTDDPARYLQIVYGNVQARFYRVLHTSSENYHLRFQKVAVNPCNRHLRWWLCLVNARLLLTLPCVCEPRISKVRGIDLSQSNETCCRQSEAPSVGTPIVRQRSQCIILLCSLSHFSTFSPTSLSWCIVWAQSAAGLINLVSRVVDFIEPILGMCCAAQKRLDWVWDLKMLNVC